jgi:DNA-directed RNA polymerase subunit K/omega
MSNKKSKVSKKGGNQTDDDLESLSDFEDVRSEIKDTIDIEQEEISESEKEEENDVDDKKNNKEDDEEETVEVDKDEEEDEKQTKSQYDDEEGDETCLYNIKKRNVAKILDSDEFDDDVFENENYVLTKKIVPPEERITNPVLTKYERVRILSERRQQLIYGAKPMVKVNDNISEKEIANLELQHKVIPFIIVRTLPSGKIEHWKLSELEIIN